MKKLYPEHKEVYKFLGCEQRDKINVKRVAERGNNNVRKRAEQLMITTRWTQLIVGGTHIWILGEVNKIRTKILRNEGFHGKQASEERLYTKRKDGSRGQKSFINIYKETKVRVVCYTFFYINNPFFTLAPKIV